MNGQNRKTKSKTESDYSDQRKSFHFIKSLSTASLQIVCPLGECGPNDDVCPLRECGPNDDVSIIGIAGMLLDIQEGHF